MKRIGLTQRAHALSSHGERRDMLDQRWSVLIERLGACPLGLSNRVVDVVAYLDALALDALVLTGGNDLSSLPGAADAAPERDRFEALAYRYFLNCKKPVLGVCRGAQVVNHLSGGALVRAQAHAGSRHGVTWAPDLASYWDCPVEVNSYHNWAIPSDGLAPIMRAAAMAHDGTIEAFYSECDWVHAILWHPEREPDLGASALSFLGTVLDL